MQTKKEVSDPRPFLWGSGLLAVGIVIGLVAKPGDWLSTTVAAPEPSADSRQTEEPVALALPLARGVGTREFPEAAALETLRIDVTPEHAESLQRVYDRSMKSGMIIKSEVDLVPATIHHGDKAITGKVRIKGDYLDHLNSDKWSLRIELDDDKLFGMRRFSIQHPKTRGYLWEWLIMKAAQRFELLAPRVDFVNVVINDNPVGIYYLEEHFTKELLESQGRREGPIVRFDERVLMDVFDEHYTRQYLTPETLLPGTLPQVAEVGAFGEKRLAQNENLNRALQRAIQKMHTMQAAILQLPYMGGTPGAIEDARERAGNETIETAFDLGKASRMHALLALFRCKHGMGWKDRNFYFNQITDRLEPILCDTLAGTPIPERDPLAMYTYTTKVFTMSPSYYRQLFIYLSKVSNVEFLQGLFEAHEADLRRFSAIMAAEGIANEQTDVDAIQEMLWDQQNYLRLLLTPKNGINFDSRLLSGEGPGGELNIDVWGTSRVPLVFRGFHFHDGRFLPARSALAPGQPVSRVFGEPGAVLLPWDGQHVSFRFPADIRLATLRDVEAIKASLITASAKDKSVKLSISAEYRFLPDDVSQTEKLVVRRFGEDWGQEGGRPTAPTLEEALLAHEFLTLDVSANELVCRPGAWNVEGDLLVPNGYPLRMGPGTELVFRSGKALISNEPLRFEGSQEAPIVLRPRSSDSSWAGVSVLEAPGDSVWRHVQVKGTDVIRRGGWVMTGGITFYRSRIEMYGCRFEDAHGEDALNIYGTRFLLDGVVIDGVASDAFDGDFVTGAVRNCTILNSVEDAVDVSGSDIDVENCRFIAIGDKAISAGENSIVRARDCVIESSSIGLASKDKSRMIATGIEIKQATNYGLAVFIKKPEFGSSSIIADDIQLGNIGRGPHIVQLTCELVLEGQRVRGVEVDVKEMYRLKILGQ